MDQEAIQRLYMRVFNTDDGKLVLEDIGNRCFKHIPSTEDHCDPYLTIKNEGKRSVILHIETNLKPIEIKEE